MASPGNSSRIRSTTGGAAARAVSVPAPRSAAAKTAAASGRDAFSRPPSVAPAPGRVGQGGDFPRRGGGEDDPPRGDVLPGVGVEGEWGGALRLYETAAAAPR